MLVSPWRRIVDSPAAPVALLLVFALLIVVTITRFSTWIDESATLLLVGPHSYGEILRYVKLDAHPPLWYFVLKPWLTVFGTHVLASRAQSAVFMLIAFAVWYHFVKTRFSRPLALVALALMVVNPMLLHYAIEGRMYAFSILLVAISCVVITRPGTGRRRWIAYWVLAVAMLYAHYFLAFAVAAQFVYLLLRRADRGLSVLWIVVYGASIVAVFLPWLPYAFHMTSSVVSNGYWIPPVVPSTVTSYVWHAFLHHLDGDLSGAYVFPALGFFVTLVLALVRARRATGGPFALVWCLACVPWVFLFVLSCKPFPPIFHPRYVIFGLPALLTLLAAGALAMKGRWRAGVIAVLVVGSMFGIANQRRQGFNDNKGFWAMDRIAEEIGQPVDGELPTIVSSWLFPFFDARVMLDPKQPIMQLRDSAPSSKSFPDVLYYDKPDWYVTSLRDVHARHVWFLEENLTPTKPVPYDWELETTHVHGYVRARLFKVPDPTAAQVP